MYSVFMTYYNDLKAAGVSGFNFTDLVFPTSMYGEWGGMNYIGEPTSLTPKYNALINFIDSQGPYLGLSDPTTTATAGTSSSFTVTAYNADGSVNTGYTGTDTFSSSDPNAVLPSSYTFTAADAGVHTFADTLDTAGPQSITVTDSKTAASAHQSGISVQAASASSIAVVGYPGTVTAGVYSSLTLWAMDPYGNIATGYTGTVQLTSSDAQAQLPSNITFTAGNLGTATASVALGTAGVQSITATDTSASGVTGNESGIIVQPNSVATLQVTSFPSPAGAGAANNFAVTATDSFGNVISDYTGTVSFTSSDPNATLPASYTFTSADAGTHQFSATLVTAGTQNVKATDTANSKVTGSDTGISVVSTATTASRLAVSGLSGGTAGTASTFTVTAYDQYGNVATAYTGSVAFTSSDSQATLPANYTFTRDPGDAGVHTFSATLKTAGTQSITGTDTSNSSVTSTESGIKITPAAASNVVLSGFPTTAQAGTAYVLTVTIYDSYGNVATGYNGSIDFASSDAQAVLPANYTFNSNDKGTHSFFTTTLNTVGTQSITVATTGKASLTDTDSGIAVQTG